MTDQIAGRESTGSETARNENDGPLPVVGLMLEILYVNAENIVVVVVVVPSGNGPAYSGSTR